MSSGSFAGWFNMYLEDFRSTGKELFCAGLVKEASGNLSLRVNRDLIITRHGGRLFALEPGDLIRTGIYQDDAFTFLASWELPVHRAVYKNTPALAIAHAHPPYAVALSLVDAVIDGRVPVIGEKTEIVPGVMEEEISNALKSCFVVMVKGHGSFAAGRTLDEACGLTLEFEEECRKLCRARGILPGAPVE